MRSSNTVPQLLCNERAGENADSSNNNSPTLSLNKTVIEDTAFWNVSNNFDNSVEIANLENTIDQYHQIYCEPHLSPRNTSSTTIHSSEGTDELETGNLQIGDLSNDHIGNNFPELHFEEDGNHLNNNVLENLIVENPEQNIAHQQNNFLEVPVQENPEPNMAENENQPAQDDGDDQPIQHGQPGGAEHLIQGSMALAFKPGNYNGLHNGNRWLQNFNRYTDLTGLNDISKANLFGLCLNGPALTWFNSLTNDERHDFPTVEHLFREKYIIAAPTQVERQMATLTNHQLPNQTVDEYIMNSRERMVEFGFNLQLQVTLLLNGLRPELRSIMLQHLPFNDIDAFIDKAKHVEAAVASKMALGPQNVVSTPVFPVNMCPEDDNEAVVKSAVDKMVSIVQKKLSNMQFSEPDDQFSRGRPRNKQKVRFSDTSRSGERERRCFNCSSKYHLQRNCPDLYSNVRSYPQRGSYRFNSSGGFNRGNDRFNSPGGFNRGNDRFNSPGGFNRGNDRGSGYIQASRQDQFNGFPRRNNQRSNWFEGNRRSYNSGEGNGYIEERREERNGSRRYDNRRDNYGYENRRPSGSPYRRYSKN